VQELAPGIFVETGFRRINVGAILTNNGFVLIDTPPYPQDARRWQAVLQSLSDKPVLAIINTDFHRDRILGNCWFDPAVIVGHDQAIDHVDDLPSSFLETAVEALTNDGALDTGSCAGLRLCGPSVGFTRRMQLRYSGRTIQLLAMPGPTAGSVWVHLPEQRILFAGDSVIINQHLHISSPCTKSWLDSLIVLRRLRFPADQIVPGRGALVDKSATELVSTYLRLARRRVHSLYHAGRPRADTSSLVPELLEQFPYHNEDLEQVQRRIKAGLDRIYEEFKDNDKTND
jgi:cyclase